MARSPAPQVQMSSYLRGQESSATRKKRRSALRALAGNALLAGVLAKRDLRSQLRSPRSALIVAAFVAACCFAAGYFWPAENAVMELGAYTSRRLVRGIAVVLMAVSGLFVPALGATSIVLERERDTWDMLRMTLIGRTPLLLGKAAGTLAFFFIALVAAMPVFAATFFLVGLDWVELSEIGALLAATALACALAGLYGSATQRSLGGALFAGSLAGMLYLSGLLVFAPLSPVLLVNRMFTQGLHPALFAVGMVFQALVVLLFYVLTHRAVWRALHGEDRVSMVRRWSGPALPALESMPLPFYLIEPAFQKPEIEDGRNPILLREVRWAAGPRIFLVSAAVWLYGAAWVVTSLPAYSHSPEAVNYAARWMAFQMILTILAAPAVNASVLTKEFEHGTIDLLRTTLIGPRDLILGKWGACMVILAPFFLAGAIATVPAMAVRPGLIPVLLPGLVAHAICIALSGAVTVLASAATSRTVTAAALSYVIALPVFFFAPLLDAVGLPLGLPGTPDTWTALYDGLVGSPAVIILGFGFEFGHEPGYGALFFSMMVYPALCLLFLWLALDVFSKRWARTP